MRGRSRFACGFALRAHPASLNTRGLRASARRPPRNRAPPPPSGLGFAVRAHPAENPPSTKIVWPVT